jgi:hypothetical protein
MTIDLYSGTSSKVMKDVPCDLLGMGVETRLSQARRVEIIEPPAPLNRAGRKYGRTSRKAIAGHMGQMRLALKHVGGFGENRCVRRSIAKAPVGLISQKSW